MKKSLLIILSLLLSALIYAYEWNYSDRDFSYELIDYDQGEIFILEISPDNFNIEFNYKKERIYLDQLNDNSIIFAINGSYFYTDDDNYGIPVGLLKTSKGMYGSINHKYPFFYILGDKAGIVKSSQWILSELDSDILAFQSGPMLIWNNLNISISNKKISERSAIGITSDGSIVFCITKNAFLELNELASLLRKYGCVKALNLDGGGSSQAIFRHKDFSWQSSGYYRVPFYITVKPE